MKKLSIVVPCYNEQETIYPFLEATQKVEQQMKDQLIFDYIFVNDGSKDDTLTILRDVAKRFDNVHYLSFSRNFGKEAAMFAGLEKATGDYVVIMDADLQHPPRLLPDMYHACKYEGYDCAAGKRVDRTGEGRLRNFLSHSFYKVIQKLTKMDMDDGAGDFRMMSRQMVDAILELKEYNRYMKGLFSFVGFDTKWIEFHNVERAAGQTKWNFTSLFSYAFKGIFSFSATPITFAGIIGTFLIFLSLIISVISVVMHYHTLVINLILFLSGVQLIFVSILGQYCTSCYFETKKRPIYIIKDTNRKY